jgi:hypothetical protein
MFWSTELCPRSQFITFSGQHSHCYLSTALTPIVGKKGDQASSKAIRCPQLQAMDVNIETGRELDSSQHVHSCLARNERALISTQLPRAYQQAKACPSSLVPDVPMRRDMSSPARNLAFFSSSRTTVLTHGTWCEQKIHPTGPLGGKHGLLSWSSLARADGPPCHETLNPIVDEHSADYTLWASDSRLRGSTKQVPCIQDLLLYQSNLVHKLHLVPSNPNKIHASLTFYANHFRRRHAPTCV